MRAMCGSAAHWDFASQNKEDKLPEPAATRLLTQLVSFASQNKEDYMANVIDDATIDYVGILAKLELSDEEKEQAKKDMASMLDYIDQLNELDTTGV